MTISRQDANTILIEGSLAATISNGEYFPNDNINSDFDTVLLDNSNSLLYDKINIDEAQDFDDEVGPNGEIDIGEIASQYLSLELF